MRGDRIAQNVINTVAIEKGPVLLATLWQLHNVDFSNLKDFRSIAPTTAHSVFTHGIGVGVTQFSSDFMSHIQDDYLQQRPELAVCIDVRSRDKVSRRRVTSLSVCL